MPSARASTSSARRRPSTGCSPSGPSCGRSSAAPHGLGGRAAQPRGDRRLPRGDWASRSPTATGRPRPAPVTGMRPDEDDPARDGSMGRPLPGIEARGSGRSGRARRAAVSPAPSPPSSAATSTASPSTASGGRPATRSAEDEDGYLWFEGRDDDMIFSAGYRIGPVRGRVGAGLASGGRRGRRGRRARRRARLGGPGDRRAPRRRAPRAARAPSSRSTCKAVTAPYKYPRIVEFADELPKTPSGKIKRAELRACEPAERPVGSRSPGSSSSPTSGCSRSGRRCRCSPTT